MSIVLELVPTIMWTSVEHFNWEIKIKGRKFNLVTRKIRRKSPLQPCARLRRCAPLCGILRCSPVLRYGVKQLIKHGFLLNSSNGFVVKERIRQTIGRNKPTRPLVFIETIILIEELMGLIKRRVQHYLTVTYPKIQHTALHLSFITLFGIYKPSPEIKDHFEKNTEFKSVHLILLNSNVKQIKIHTIIPTFIFIDTDKRNSNLRTNYVNSLKSDIKQFSAVPADYSDTQTVCYNVACRNIVFFLAAALYLIFTVCILSIRFIYFYWIFIYVASDINDGR